MRASQLSIFPEFRVRGSDRRYATIQEAARAAGRVSLCGEDDGRLFEAIEQVRPADDSGLGELRPGKRPIEASYLAEKAVEALKRAVLEAWDPEREHIIPHSSGYDSRLINAVIWQLADEQGQDWLGKTRFFCWEPEIFEFQRIMRFMGWPEDMAITVPAERAEDYWVPALNFKVLGRWMSGLVRKVWLGPVLMRRTLEEMGVGQNNPQVISPLFSDETLAWSRRDGGSWDEFAESRFQNQPHPWPGGGAELVLPYLSAPWIETLSQYEIPLNVDDFKLEMLMVIEPSLADPFGFQNMRYMAGQLIKAKGHTPWDRISTNTRAMMLRNYADSEYGRQMPEIEGKPFMSGEDAVGINNAHLYHYVRAAVAEDATRNAERGTRNGERGARKKRKK